MKREYKELLLKDICARVPYKVCVEHTSGFRGTLHDITVYCTYNDDDTIKDYLCYTNFFKDESCKIEFFKPYLFPLSSMTEEQCYELASIRSDFQDCWKYIKTPIPLSICNFEQIDWLHKNHFDYRGLIEKGLALDATGLNIY